MSKHPTIEALNVTCPACQARPGDPCVMPTDTGTRPVLWVHYSREDRAYRMGGTDYLAEKYPEIVIIYVRETGTYRVRLWDSDRNLEAVYAVPRESVLRWLSGVFEEGVSDELN